MFSKGKRQRMLTMVQWKVFTIGPELRLVVLRSAHSSTSRPSWCGGSQVSRPRAAEPSRLPASAERNCRHSHSFPWQPTFEGGYR